MKKIKAIIFDLDDTLVDTTRQIKDKALQEAVQVMINAGLPCTKEEGFITIKDIISKDPKSDKFKLLAEKYNRPDLAEIGKEKYYNKADLEGLAPFPGTIEVLNKLKKEYKLAIVSTGRMDQQMRKLNQLKIKEYFSTILINEILTKEECFKEAIKKLGFKPEEIIAVGDKIDSEVFIANKLGMTTVHKPYGSYISIEPKNEMEKPDFTIKNIRELLGVLEEVQ